MSLGSFWGGLLSTIKVKSPRVKIFSALSLMGDVMVEF